MKDLKGKTIIIFGATGGLGEPVAREFHLAGANLVLVARNLKKLAKLKGNLSNGGKDGIIAISADASNIKDVDGVFFESKNEFKKIDGVMIFVGTHEPISINKNTAKKVVKSADNLYNSLLKPAIVVGALSAKFFKKQGFGLIVHSSSHVVRDRTLENNDTYRAMKMASTSFMLDIGSQLKSYGVRIVDLQPGTILTPGNKKYLDTVKKRNAAIKPETIAEWIINNFDNPNIPLEQYFKSDARF